MTSSNENLSSEEGISIYFVVFSSMLALVLVLSKILHDRPAVASILPEAGMVLLIGMIAGFFVNLYADTQSNDGDGDGVIDDDAIDVEVAESLLSFSPQVFFIALLPPIIFNSGYHLRRELFFRHMTPICLLACLGTTISAVSIALVLELATFLRLTGSVRPTFTELLTFGGLISATDPVSTLAVFQSKRIDPHLFYLVFGESVLNDAVGLVLFNAFAKFVRRNNEAGRIAVGILDFFLDFTFSFLGSLCLGVFSAILAAFLLKIIDMRSTKLLELSLYVLIMYVPYLLAEMMQLSGIVTILFTGVAARRFVIPNLSTSTQSNADVLFRLAAHLAETSIFLELGLSVFALAGHFSWRFVLWSLLACLVGRALNVYPIVFLFNLSLKTNQSGVQEAMNGEVEMRELPEVVPATAPISKETKIGGDMRIASRTAHMLWFSGLRGAVAYACVRTFPVTFGHRRFFIITTMAIVLVTVFLLGGTTKCMLDFLEIEMDVDEDKYMETATSTPLFSRIVDRFEHFVSGLVIRPQADPCSPSSTTTTTTTTTTSDPLMDRAELVGSSSTPEKQDDTKKSLYDYGSKKA